MPGYGPAPSPEQSLLLAQPDVMRYANPHAHQYAGEPVGAIGNFLQNVMAGVNEGTMLPTGFRTEEPAKPMPWTQTLALLGATMAEPMPDFLGPIASKVFKKIGQLKKPLERLTDNYRVPLAQHTDVLYRETSLDELDSFLPFSFRDMTHEQMYMANDPMLALGQGRNKGVMLEFDPSKLQGQLNTQKPTWSHSYSNGGAEFVATLNRQEQYQDALRSVLIAKNAPGDRMIQRRIQNLIPALERAGWGRTALEDGSIFLTKPNAPKP